MSRYKEEQETCTWYKQNYFLNYNARGKFNFYHYFYYFAIEGQNESNLFLPGSF